LFNVVDGESVEGTPTPLLTIRRVWWRELDTRLFIQAIAFFTIFGFLFALQFDPIVGLSVFLLFTVIYLVSLVHSHHKWLDESVSVHGDALVHEIEGREPVVLPLDGDCVIEVPLREGVLECEGDPEYDSRRSMDAMAGTRIARYARGIRVTSGGETLFISPEKGWTREDVQGTWETLLPILSRNHEVVLGREMRCLLIYLEHLGSGSAG